MVGLRAARSSPPPGRAVAGAARFLYVKFPPAQAIALALASLVTYLACGRLGTGEATAGWPAVAASLTGMLFFLQVRLLDDYDTHFSAPHKEQDGTPRGLLAGAGVTTILILALNTQLPLILFAAAPAAVMLGASAVLALWCPLRTTRPLTRHRPDLIALFLGRIPLFDAGPALALAYVAARWEDSAGGIIPRASSWLAIGTVWILYEIWKVSRNIGRYEGYDDIYQPYRLSWAQQRVLVAVLALLNVPLSVALYSSADLSAAYLAYSCALSALLAFLALSGLRSPERPWWRGLAFPGFLLAGLLVQFLVLL